jgi:hypothetical protein
VLLSGRAVLVGDGPVLVEDHAGVLADRGVQGVGGPVLVGDGPAL